MKRSHIVILVGIAALIVGLIAWGFPSSDFSTFDTIGSAKSKKGKPVHLIASLDLTKPIEYDPIKDPNYLTFHIKDSLGSEVKVVYHNSKPTEFERSERVVLQGTMNGDVFECKNITLKCPSKYKDDKNELQKTVVTSNATPQINNSQPDSSKYSGK